MAKEVQAILPSTPTTAYYVTRNAVGQFRNASTLIFEAYNASNWATYAGTITRVGSTIHYDGDFSGPAGVYEHIFYAQAGGSPAITDTFLGNDPNFYWNGTTRDFMAAVTLAGVTHTGAVIPTVSTLTGHTPQTGDSYARIGANGAGLTALAPASTALSTAQWSNSLATGLGTLASHDPGSTLAASSEVTGLNVNTRANIAVPIEIELPDTGTQVFKIRLFLFDEVGNMEAPDSTPTITLVNAAGTDRSSRLSSASNPSTGVYSWDYTATAGDAEEQLNWTFSVTEGGATRTYPATSYIVEETAYRFSSSDRATLNSRASQSSVDALPAAVWENTERTLSEFSFTVTTDDSVSIAAILADTNELQTDWVNGGRLDLLLDSVLSTAGSAASSSATAASNAATAASNASTAAANASTAAANASTAASNSSEAAANAELAANSAEAARIAAEALPTLEQFLAGGDVDGFTVEESLKLVLAVCVGRLLGGGTDTNTFRAADNSKSRVVAQVDINGNRTSIVLDATG